MAYLNVYDKQLILQYLDCDDKVILKKLNSTWRKMINIIHIKSVKKYIPFDAIDTYLMMTDDSETECKLGIVINSYKIIDKAIRKYKKRNADYEVAHDDYVYNEFEHTFWNFTGKYACLHTLKRLYEQLNSPGYAEPIIHSFLGAIETTNDDIMSYLLEVCSQQLLVCVELEAGHMDPKILPIVVALLISRGGIAKECFNNKLCVDVINEK